MGGRLNVFERAFFSIEPVCYPRERNVPVSFSLYFSFFDELISKGKKENIVFLTTDAKFGLSVQNIAREKDLRLRWYSINNEGKLISLFVDFYYKLC